MGAREPRRGIQSVETAFRVLTTLQSSREPLALKAIALGAGLTSSAANNYLVSLTRTGLAAMDVKPGHYRLGPAALGLGMSAIQQIDGFEIVRQAVNALRDTTRRSAAVTAWSADGPVSLFKQDGDHRGAWEMRTGLVPLLSTAAGKAFVASLPRSATAALIEREWKSAFGTKGDARAFRDDVVTELRQHGFVTVFRSDLSGYISIASPIWDANGRVTFVLSLVGTRATLDMDGNGPHIAALLAGAARATQALGGTAPPSVHNLAKACSEKGG